jgi:hypothetical protein
MRGEQAGQAGREMKQECRQAGRQAKQNGRDESRLETSKGGANPILIWCRMQHAKDLQVLPWNHDTPENHLSSTREAQQTVVSPVQRWPRVLPPPQHLSRSKLETPSSSLRLAGRPVTGPKCHQPNQSCPITM